MSWIQTYTGKKFDPTCPDPELICIEDIAHALAMQCRFTGHCREFYSVAQHSVLASLHCHPKDAMWGLLHDASEAYLCDVARPVKHHPAMEQYRILEDQLQAVICKRFGLPAAIPDSVKQADRSLLVTEARDLMSPLASDWKYSVENGYVALSDKIEPVSPRKAKAMFLDRFLYLEAA